MKNIKIFPEDWLQLYPYRQNTLMDSYYIGIANRIYDIMERTELISSFEGEEIKQICIRVAVYFEDVISDMGLWCTFILTHKELYDKYLPFYTSNDHYCNDEVNLEDVRFLLWRYIQQYHGYRKGTFVSSDNPANESTGMFIYDLFCKGWVTAPENTRMAKLFAPDTHYERQEDYGRLLQWFHYESYILPESVRKLSGFIRDRWKEQPDLNQEQLNNLLVNNHGMMAYTSKTSSLGLTSPQWLAKILPAEHPDHAVFQNTADESVATLPNDMLEENRQQYGTFRKTAGDKLLLYFGKAEDAQTFVTETSDLIPAGSFHLPGDWQGRKLTTYATPEGGAQATTQDAELAKDESSPFCDANHAAKQALSFFVVKRCNVYFLRELVDQGMLADIQAKSLTSPERDKTTIQENWEFLARYFIREYPNK